MKDIATGMIYTFNGERVYIGDKVFDHERQAWYVTGGGYPKRASDLGTLHLRRGSMSGALHTVKPALFGMEWLRKANK